MGFISADIIAEIRERIDIVQLVAEYVKLIPSGSSYKALCPMHKEKTPSFHVVPAKQIFHCFGCNKGGDVFSFIMEMEKLTFPEAVRFLAKKSSVEISENKSGDYGEKQLIYDILNKAADFYASNLFAESIEAKAAIEYLRGKRKLTDETVKEFRIGLAPNAWDTLLKRMTKNKYDINLLEKAGLVKARSSRNGYYDVFRNRIMIPIIDIHGRVSGFGGRVLSENDEPKYLNSQETETFNKRKMLFNFRKALPVIRKLNSVVIVEGYLDVISLWQHGIKNVVATLGTAITPEQIQKLARNCETLYLCYDADTAGQRATLRAISLQKDTPVNARVVRFENPEDDPDSFIQREGAEKFKKLLEDSSDIYTFLVYTHTRGLKPPLEIPIKEKLINEFKELVPAIHSSIARSEVIRKISKLIDVEPFILEKEFAGKMAPADMSMARKARRVVSSNLNAEVKRQEWVLKHLIEHPQEIERVKALITPEDFTDPELKSIFEVISFQQEATGEGVKPTEILDVLDDNNLASRFTGLITSLEDKMTEPFMDCVKGMAKASLKRKLNLIQKRISVAEEQGVDDDIAALTMQQIELRRRIEVL